MIYFTKILMLIFSASLFLGDQFYLMDWSEVFQTNPITYHEKVQSPSDMKMGPFVRTPDGSIVTIGETECLISADEGKTWESYPIFNYENAYKIRPERALICTKEGTLILAFANDVERRNWDWQEDIHDSPEAILPTYAVRSLDGGKTWEVPRKLHDDWTGAIRDIAQTENGTVIFTSMMMRHNPGHHTVVTYATSDEGETWKRSNVIDYGGVGHHSGLIEATIEPLKDGRIWMLIRTVWGVFWEAFSYDEGLTWKNIAATEIKASTAPGLVKRLASGRLILVYNQLYPEGETTYRLSGGKGQWAEVPAVNHRKELSIRFSEDDGKSWSEPIVVARTERDISYPYLFEKEPGIIWLTTWRGELRAVFSEKDFID